MAGSNALVLIFTIASCIYLSDATRCIPFSEFKSDCNKCVCNYNGMEYTCTKKICRPVSYEKNFNVETRDDGRVILKPKEDSFTFEDDDFVLTKNQRYPRVVPYASDEESRYASDEESKDDEFEFSEDGNDVEMIN